MKKFKLAQTTNPFPGLRPFDESEQHLFFGRESQIDAMVDKLAANRFLAVVGSSGSGKSSLVNCGLRPALHTGLMASAGTAWRMAQCRPGGDPITALSNALAVEGVLFNDYQDMGMSLPEIVDTTLRMGNLGLIDIVEQAQLPAGTNLLLVIDQFEELFRYRHLDKHGENKISEVSQQAVAFVNLLLAAIAQSDLPVYIVITMRSDFLGDCAQFTGLAEAINSGQYLVPRMTREQRRAAITGPIGVGGAKIYPALLTRLVNDVGTNPDQLSILQHALNRTWSYWENERGRQGMLDIECYDSIGSMTRALDQHANKAFAELGSSDKERICKTLFKALTDKANDARGVRRPTRLGTLCEMCGATHADVVSVIDVFRKPSRSFLMPPAGVELHPDTVIDISHESLMRVWKKLDQWADQEADSARMYQRLAETSALYQQQNAGLLRDPDLRVALKWREQNKPNDIWASQYNSDFDGAMAFLKQSEKSELKRKRLRVGSIAAVVLSVPGYLAYTSYNLSATNAELTTQNKVAEQEKKVALDELDEAEQEAIVALNEAEQAKSEVEENLTRILSEEIEHIQEATVQPASTTQSSTLVAKEQIQFFSAISALNPTQQETVAEYFTQLEADRNRLQAERLGSLAHYQQLIIQKKVQCEVVSVGENSEQTLDQQQATNCSEHAADESLFVNLNDRGNVANSNCEPDGVPVNALATLSLQEQELIDRRNTQLVCDIEFLRKTTADLDNASTRLQQEIDNLKGSVIEIRDTIESPIPASTPTENPTLANTSVDRNTQKLTSVEGPVPSSKRLADASKAKLNKTDRTDPRISAAEPVLPEQNSEEEQVVATVVPEIDLNLFQACENVEKLEPSGCKSENESFQPGKVFVFARIVTSNADEELTLRWFDNGTDEQIDQKQFTVQPNPAGYRTYTWKMLNDGSYRACLYDQSELELECISIQVGIENSVTLAEAEESPTVTLPDVDVDVDTQQPIASKDSVVAESSANSVPETTAAATEQSNGTDANSGWTPTRLEDSKNDGFVVCKDVDKLQPLQCGTELEPGRVYAFARIVTPHDEETVQLQWFKDDREIPELRKELEIKKNSSGFRTYSWNTFDTGSYSVSLLDESGEELRKISFEVK